MKHETDHALEPRLHGDAPPVWKSYCSIVVTAALAIAPSIARAETDADVRCRRIRAEADSTAHLLFAPEIVAQVFRLPETGDTDPQTLLGDRGVGARALVAFSAIDVLRARKVRGAARAECGALRAAEPVERVLAAGVQYGRAGALRAEIAHLERRAPRIDEILDDARQRRARQLITLLELDDLTTRALELRRRLAEARHDLAILEAEGHVEPLPRDAVERLAAAERQTMAMERERSSLRRLAGWDVELQLGAVPGERVEGYGMIAITFDLGALGQARAERRYLAARRDELAGDDAALRTRLARFGDAMASSAADLVDELALVDEQLALLEDERTQLARREADARRHLDAAIELDVIELEARRAYLETLIGTRREAAAVRTGHHP